MWREAKASESLCIATHPLLPAALQISPSPPHSERPRRPSSCTCWRLGPVVRPRPPAPGRRRDRGGLHGGFALLLVQLRGVGARQTDGERFFDDHLQLGLGIKLLLSIEHQHFLDPLYQLTGRLLRCGLLLIPAALRHRGSICLACSSFALIRALHLPPGVLAPEGGA